MILEAEPRGFLAIRCSGAFSKGEEFIGARIGTPSWGSSWGSRVWGGGDAIAGLTCCPPSCSPVCADNNHVRTWSVTRFRGMISTQPGSTPLASFKILALESADGHGGCSAGNDIGAYQPLAPGPWPHAPCLTPTGCQWPLPQPGGPPFSSQHPQPR